MGSAQALPGAGADETMMAMLNALQRAERTVLNVKRPQGTWSRTLFAVIERLLRFQSGGATAMVRADDRPYVETWFRLRQPAGKADNPTQQAYPQMTTSTRAGQTILDLRLLSGGMSVDMTVRRASDGTSDPFIIHQLLVQDGYPPLYRLRFGAAPASAK
jgi:hypothetical protein